MLFFSNFDWRSWRTLWIGFHFEILKKKSFDNKWHNRFKFITWYCYNHVRTDLFEPSFWFIKRKARLICLFYLTILITAKLRAFGIDNSIAYCAPFFRW